MPNAALTVDPIASYARLDGDGIRVVLTVSDLTATTDRAWVRFVGEHGATRARASVTPVGSDSRVEVTVPASDLRTGVWRLRLRLPEAPLRNLRTRLLVSDTQPIALLPGPEPKTIMTDHTD